MTYEKEILALKTPLTQDEVMYILMRYGEVGFFKFVSGLKFEFKYTETGIVYNLFYIPLLDLSTRDEIETDELSQKDMNEHTEKDFYGFIELNPLAAGENMPFLLRIVSSKEDCDFLWMKIAEDILRESKSKIPDFSPDLGVRIPSRKLVDILAKPQLPEKPPIKSDIKKWFDYFYLVKKAGYKITLEELANESRYSYGYIRSLHQTYVREHVIDLTETSDKI